MKTIKPNQISKELNDIVIGYNNDVIDAVKKETTKASKELVVDLKGTTPVDPRHQTHLKDTWKSRVKVDLEGVVGTIYSDPKMGKYRIIHLLEHGTINMRPQPFVAPAYNRLNYYSKIKNIIERESK